MATALAARVSTALVLIVAVLAALFLLPPPGFGVALLIVVILAAREWARLAGFARGGSLLFVAGTFLLGLNLLFGPGTHFDGGWPKGIVLAVCGAATAFWICVAAPWTLLRWRRASPLVSAVAGWIVLMGAFVALVQLHAHSPWLVLAAMAIVWIADTAAFFAGRAFGRHKLAPQVSPGKTWEGVAGGVMAVVVYAVALVPLAARAGYRGPLDAASIAAWIAIVIALAALSVIGDLYESLLKRYAGVKDSGTLLPGHGGVLDRTDALLAAMPPASLCALFFLARP